MMMMVRTGGGILVLLLVAPILTIHTCIQNLVWWGYEEAPTPEKDANKLSQVYLQSMFVWMVEAPAKTYSGTERLCQDMRNLQFHSNSLYLSLMKIPNEKENNDNDDACTGNTNNSKNNRRRATTTTAAAAEVVAAAEPTYKTTKTKI